jgi:hypothetical protein
MLREKSCMELRVITLNQTNKQNKKAQIEAYTLTTTTTNKIFKFTSFLIVKTKPDSNIDARFSLR